MDTSLATLSKHLPDKFHTFTIDIEGNFSKLRYEGEFTCQISNLKTQAQIAKYRALLNNGLESMLDLSIQNLHTMVSYLKYAVTASPQWFIDSECGYTIDDINVVEKIYSEVLKFENNWMNGVWGALEEVK